MINVISTQDELFKDYIFDDEERVIKNLSQINIFIGENNSGKSRFLRGLFSINDFQYLSYGIDLKKINNELKLLKENIKNIISKLQTNLESFEDTYLSRIGISETINSNNKSELAGSLQVIRTLSIFNSNDLVHFSLNGMISPKASELVEEINRICNSFLESKSAAIVGKFIEDNPGYPRYYIPILRGLRHLDNSPYLNRTLNDYFDDKKDSTLKDKLKDFIFTSEGFNEDIKRQKLNVKKIRKRVEDFESFLREKFFPFAEEFTITPDIDKSYVVSVYFGEKEGEDKGIQHLGDGVQALIALLYHIFMKEGERAIFFIEEPELNLHPGMQRVFLETLMDERFKDMQFFFTTHSNHFLDLTLETDKISVYHFNKTKDLKFEVKNKAHGDENILKSLGVRNSSVFLSNCTIWVEGITDRKYIRKYLELYFNEHKSSFIEDLHYSFVEYAGSNITHWDFETDEESENIFAKSLNQNIFLIVDSDCDENGKISDAKTKRNIKLAENLKGNFYITEGKEIENSLSFDTIKKVVADYETKGRIEDLVFDLAKVEQEKIELESHNSTEKIRKPIYWNKNIGEFIEIKLGTNKKRKTYVKVNGLYKKEVFCDKAIKHLQSYEDLSSEAKTIVERIVKFIERYNS